jgi:hypothetical protein
MLSYRDSGLYFIGDWFCDKCVVEVCVKCNGIHSDEGNEMIYCDGCCCYEGCVRGRWHLKCLPIALECVPPGELAIPEPKLYHKHA